MALPNIISTISRLQRSTILPSCLMIPRKTHTMDHPSTAPLPAPHFHLELSRSDPMPCSSKVSPAPHSSRIVRRISMTIKVHHNHRPRQWSIRKLHINPRQPLETCPETRIRKRARHWQKPRIVDQFLADRGTGAVLDARELDRAGDGDGRIARCIVELAGVVNGIFIEVGGRAVARARMVLAKAQNSEWKSALFQIQKVDELEGVYGTSRPESASPFGLLLVEP